MYFGNYNGLKEAQIILTCQSLTCNELRQLLKESALPTDGRKAVLVQRVLQNIFPNPLHMYTPMQANTLRDKIVGHFFRKKGVVDNMDIYEISMGNGGSSQFGQHPCTAVQQAAMSVQQMASSMQMSNQLNGAARRQLGQLHIGPKKTTRQTPTRTNNKESVLLQFTNDDGSARNETIKALDLFQHTFTDPFYEKREYLFLLSSLFSQKHRFDHAKKFVTATFAFKTNMHGYSIFANNDLGVYLRLFCVQKQQANSAPLTDRYPSHLTVTVNKSPVKIPNAYLKIDRLPKKPHTPIGITGKCSYSPTSSNECVVSFLYEANVSVYAEVVVMRKLPVDSLLRRENDVSAAYWSKRILDKYFGSGQKDDEEGEILLSEATIEKDKVLELTCPISLTRMTRPARSVYCKHLRCFDLVNFVQINEKRPLWQCVLCEQFIPLDKIYTDPLYMSIIRRTEEGVKRVQLREIPEDYGRIEEFGGFEAFVEREEGSSEGSGEEERSGSRKRSKPKIDVIVIDSD